MLSITRIWIRRGECQEDRSEICTKCAEVEHTQNIAEIIRGVQKIKFKFLQTSLGRDRVAHDICVYGNHGKTNRLRD